jgi:hypothetical protein
MSAIDEYQGQCCIQHRKERILEIDYALILEITERFRHTPIVSKHTKCIKRGEGKLSSYGIYLLLILINYNSKLRSNSKQILKFSKCTHKLINKNNMNH